MNDLQQLAKNLRQLADEIPAKANGLVQQVATVVLEEIASSTPADTGAAISNWVVTVDEPSSDIIDPYSPSPAGHTKDGKWIHKVDPLITASNNIPQTLENGQTVIDSKVPGQSLFITNNVPYINELNDGSSVQTPAGFVDRGIIAAQVLLDNL